jgi:hypothetical protein
MEPNLINQEPISPNYHAYIYASEIASLIGEHPHRSQNASIYSMLQRDAYNFSIVINEIKVDTSNRIEKNVTDLITRAYTMMDNFAIELQKEKNFEDLNELLSSKTEQVVKSLSEKYKLVRENEKLRKRLEKSVKDRLRLSRGLKLEGASLNLLEKEKMKSITNRNTQSYQYKCDHYTICGKVDGIIADEKCIIEIKNRIAPLKEVPLYDKIQCLVYLKLTGYEKCLLVECFPNQSKRETLIEYSADELDRIIQKLVEVVEIIRKFDRNDVKRMIEQDDIEQLGEC